MSYPNYAHAQYKTMPQPGNARETEAWALTEAARRMAAAQSEGVSDDDMMAALRLNWRLWTIFQSEIAAPQCPLPLELRQDMLALCNFVDKHTVEILSSRDRSKLDALINVNRQIAAGLFTIPPQDAPPQEQAVAAPTATSEIA